MKVIQAVGHGLTNLFNFNGRTRQAEFWPYVVFVTLLSIAGFGAATLPEMFASMERLQRFVEDNPDLATIERGPGSYSMTIHEFHPELMPDFGQMMWLTGVGFVAIIFFLASAVVRRLHDRGKSGAWGLMPIPFIVFALVAMPKLFDQVSQVGTPDLRLFFAIFFNNILYIATLVFLIVLLCGDSTKGENRFGLEPIE